MSVVKFIHTFSPVLNRVRKLVELRESGCSVIPTFEVRVASSGKGFCDGELLIGLENHSSR